MRRSSITFHSYPYPAGPALAGLAARRCPDIAGRARPRPASRRTSARATAARPPAGSTRCGCGGAPTACRGRGRCCRCGGSAPTMPGARTRRIAAITALSGARPMNQATGFAADDGLYDLIIEIDHNTRPRVAGRGSAVFIHVARAGFGADCRLRRRYGAHDLLALLVAAYRRRREFIFILRLRRPAAENRGADPHMGGAEGDRDGEIGAHAHRQEFQPVAAGRSWRSARNAAPAPRCAAECTSGPKSSRP